MSSTTTQSTMAVQTTEQAPLLQEAFPDELQQAKRKTDLVRLIPIALFHVGCLGAFWTGASPFAIGAAVVLYFVHVFLLTGFYHRYFSHRTFKMNRFWQFFFAVITMTAFQRDPIWWAANHRHHHKHSDDPLDIHSPKDGLWWSHVGWMTHEDSLDTDLKQVPDLVKYPELMYLHKNEFLVPSIYGISLLLLGAALEKWAPQLGTNTAQLFVWAFFISSTVVFHSTWTINSLTHTWGTRRYDTTDTSRNNFLLALITLGEGWHNNHHHCQGTVRQGFYWWEIDLTYYGLVVLSWFGIVSDLRPVPARAYEEAKEMKAQRAKAKQTKQAQKAAKVILLEQPTVKVKASL